MQKQPDLDLMEHFAQPLDRWCDRCEVKIATAVSADGVACCNECQAIVLFNMTGNRKMRREAARRSRMRGTGFTR